MDFAFAPALTGNAGTVVNGMFTRRANTTFINGVRGVGTLREFIQHLDSSSSVTKPIGDILVATHANSQGYLTTLQMFSGQAGSTSYETVEDTIGSTTKSIAIPDTLIGHVAGNPITHNFHLRGCNIGKATAFLTKMKQALGGNINLTTPLHFDEFNLKATSGVWEALFYEFRLIRKTAFATRADYVSALNTTPGFAFYDGAAIPLTDWESWVPTKIDTPGSVLVSFSMGVTIDKRNTIDFKRELRYVNDKPYTVNINFPDAGQIPTDTATRLTVLQTFLSTKKYRSTDTVGAFDSAHPYAEHVRWGYASLQDFISEHDWKFSVSGKKLVCKGNYHTYTLMVPITDRAAATAGNLLFNFYPNAGSSVASITNLAETNPAFFATI